MTFTSWPDRLVKRIEKSRAKKRARVSVASGTAVELRLTIVESCARQTSCQGCEALGGAERDACYAGGCACFGDLVTERSNCTGTSYEDHRQNSIVRR